jgi:hypothetical protein
MAVETTSAAAPAASSAPASAPAAAPSSAPSSAPSAPAAAPAAPAAAPAAPAPGAPAAPAAVPAHETTQQVVTRKIKDAIAAAQAAPKPGEPAAAAPVAPVTEPPKPAEKVEEKPAEQAAAAATEDKVDIPEEDLTLDELGVLGPGDFAAKLKAAPELGKVLDAHPDVKAQVFKALRVAADSASIREIVPTKQAAEFMQKEAEFASGLREAFTDENDPQAYDKVLGMIAKESFLYDDETGEIVKDGNGIPMTDGRLEGFCDYVFKSALDAIEQAATKDEDARKLAAVKELRDGKAASSQPTEALDEKQLAKQRELESRETNLRRQEQQTLATRRTAIEERLRDDSLKYLDSQVNSVLTKFSVPEFHRDVTSQKVRAAIVDRMQNDKYYTRQRQHLLSLPQTKEVQEQRMQHARSFVQTYLMSVARPILREATAGVKAEQDKKLAKIDAQEKASRSETKIDGATPLPQPQLTSTEALNKWEGEWKASHNGRPPSTEERVKFLRMQRIGR